MKNLGVGVALILMAVPAVAMAGPKTRFNVEAIARTERVSVEGDVTHVSPVFGVGVSAHLFKLCGIEGELTGTDGSGFSHSREGISETFAAPGSSAAEIERLGVLARWSHAYRPGLGGAFAFTVRGEFNSRVDLLLRLGLSMRSYTETQEYTILRIPDGVDPRRLGTTSFGNGERSGNPFTDKAPRGGILMGIEIPIRFAKRLSVAPEVRAVYGGPADFNYKHNEMSAGVRAGWAF